jgi:hypothetical protein
MIDLFKPISDATQEIFQKKIDDRNKRALAAYKMIIWLAGDARKKDVPDLPKRLEDMRKKTEAMMQEMKITIEDGKLVVKVAGSAEDTWRMYRLGSSWFEPDKDAIERILAGLFDEAGS